jgi:hypothetical protein
MHSKEAYATINSSSSLEATEVLICITTHSRKTFTSKCLTHTIVPTRKIDVSHTIVIVGKISDSIIKINVSHI